MSVEAAIASVKTAEHLSIYPNPTGDEIRLQMQDGEIADSVEVFNVSGQRMLSFIKPDSQVIPVASLIPGMYIVYASIDGKIVQGKFVKK